MLIEILSEDKSGAVVVERLAERITENEGLDVEVNVHPHRGCGSLPKDMTAKPPKFASSLLDLLPSELRAYNKVYAGKEIILIIAMDSDDKDCNTEILDSYEQDSVCGTWEILCRAISENADDLIEIGYPAIGHYKALWAETISRYMLPQKNVSPSFNTFKMALITALKN